jgi:hypothetical protein
MNDSIYTNRDIDQWLCTHCAEQTFPYNHLSDDEDFRSALFEFCSDPLVSVLPDVQFNPLELNDNLLEPLINSDPDLQFYNDTTSLDNVMHCNYYLENSFVDKCRQMKVDSNCFSVFHLNIRSLPRNHNQLENFLEGLSFQFATIGITETWLTDSNFDCYGLKGYQHFHLNRSNKRGGGVSLFVNEGFIVKERTDLNIMTDSVEALFVEIKKENSGLDRDAIVGVVYRPPNHDVQVFNDNLAEIMHNLKIEQKIVYLMGDFNLNLLESKDHLPTSEFIDLMYSHSLFPLITKPTRITGRRATLIDNIFTSDICSIDMLNGLFYTDISDHLPVFSICCKNKISNDLKFIQTRMMKEKNIESFIGKLRHTNWESILNNQNGQVAFSDFFEKYSKLYDECFPLKTVKMNYHNRKPWLSEGLRKSIKIKNRLYLLQVKEPTDENVTAYKKYKHQLSKLMKKAERSHYSEILQHNKQNTKKMWSIIKEVISKKSHTRSPSQIKIGDRLESDKNIIADRFNLYFSHIGKDLARQIPDADISPCSFISEVNASTIFLSPVEKSEVEKIVKMLRNASAGYDGIHAKVVKSTFEYYLTPLTHVLNLSIMQGFFPDTMKVAKVVPIYKSGDPVLMTNYRPVSILPLFSKILERLMYNRMINFITSSKLLYKYQFGFRENHSTNMALVMLIDQILSSLDQSETVIGVFIDLKKAFDTVNHEILLSKLDRYGIRGVALAWIKDYLKNRMQYVSFGYANSSKKMISCGVPQGSILGPLLFLLYINDFNKISSKFVPFIFADDTNIFMKGKSLDDLVCDMNEELKKVVIWLQANKLSLNVVKTHYMFFKPKSKKYDSSISLSINGTTIQLVNSTKFIGVMLDSNLRWDHHIKMIRGKVGRGIGIICRARKALEKETLLTLYYSMIYPYLTYCVEVWGNSAQIYISTLQKLQKKVIRIITSSKPRTESDPLFKKLNILKVTQVYYYSIALFMFKFMKDMLPEVFKILFKRNYEISTRATRNSFKLNLPLCRTEAYKSSMKYQGPKIWNKLEDAINHYCSIHTFKKKLKNYIINPNV